MYVDSPLIMHRLATPLPWALAPVRFVNLATTPLYLLQEAAVHVKQAHIQVLLVLPQVTYVHLALQGASLSLALLNVLLVLVSAFII